MKSLDTLLLRLYPAEWRARYAAEFQAMLAQRPPTLRDRLDMVRGALDAQLHFPPAPAQVPRLRLALLTMFCAYVAFAVAGLALYHLVDDSPLVPLMRAHWPVALAWQALAGGALVALLAVLTGGATLIAAVVQHDLRVARRDLWLPAVPVVALGLCLAVVAATLVWFIVQYGPPDGRHPLPGGAATAGLVLWLVVTVAGGVAGLGALCRAVVRAGIGGPPLRLAVFAGGITTLAMVGMLIATLAWGLLVVAVAPGLFPAYAGQWAQVLMLMTVATLVGGVTLWRSHLPEQPQTA